MNCTDGEVRHAWAERPHRARGGRGANSIERYSRFTASRGAHLTHEQHCGIISGHSAGRGETKFLREMQVAVWTLRCGGRDVWRSG